MDKDKLKEVIGIVSKKLKEYGDIYRKNELALRTQLINPILASLGWDIEDPSEVMLEDKNEEGSADYCLIKNKEKVLFIEAKNLSQDIEEYKHMSQLAKYAVSKGVDFGLLSNGKRWLLLRTYEKNTNLADRRLWVVDILDDDIEKVVLRLKNISKDNINNLNSLIKKQDLLSETWQTIISSPESLIKPISGIIKRQMLDDNNEFSDEEIEEFTQMKVIELTKGESRELHFDEDDEDQFQKPTADMHEAGRKARDTRRNRPTAMQIRNFSKDIRFSKDILIETANYLISKGLLSKSKIPVSSGSRRYIINFKSKHPDGRPFVNPTQLSSGYWIEINNSTPRSIELAKMLLKEAGLSESELRLQY